MDDTADPTALLAHADWLRALARRLVGAAGADDAVQDTYVAALRSPPDPTRPARPWLARVLRNTTRMAHRGATRRAQREDAASAITVPTVEAPDAAVQRVETFRALVELVLALDEPLRTTLVRHYFDGDTLADIARRDGVPEGTVRWRHKQAIEQLRARLDARAHGDRKAWLAALAPIAGPPATHVTTVTIGAIVMNKIVIGAALAAIAGVVAWRIIPREAAHTSSDPRAVTAAAAIVPSSAAPPTTATAALAPRHVRQLANLDERRQLAEQIAAAQQRHASAHASPPSRAPAATDDDVTGGGGSAAAPSFGDMDKDTIQAAMREAIPFLAKCYETARPTLGADHLAIHAHLTLTGDPDIGTIIDADKVVDEHGQPVAVALDDCLRSTMQTLELPPLAEGAQVQVDYPLLFADAPPDDAGSDSADHGSAQQRKPVE